MNTKYVVRPTSQTGQSLLESVACRGTSQRIAEVSIQLPTDKAEEIAKAVNEHAALMALESACRNFPPSLLVPLAVQSALANLAAVRK